MTNKKYAKLLLDYCLEIKAGQKLYIKSTTLAEPLIRELYRESTKLGAHTVIDMAFEGQNKIFMDNASGDQLSFISPNHKEAMHEFDAYLYIKAPFNLREDQNIDGEKRKKRSEGLKEVSQAYFTRTASGDMVRSLCLYPTQASAQEAGMSLEEYTDFVFKACNLHLDDPKSAWLGRRKNQQAIVDHLNTVDQVRYVGSGTDITFSTKGRTWINSDGQTNMPSGEVYSSPIEDSMNGVIYFDYPAIRMGEELQGVTLWVENGEVKKWEAKKGKHILDKVFTIDGATRFGEVAIGTNHNINKPTKNILFDEKMGGTVHMAIGQAYLQCGGLNKSSIHWDMIAEMRNGGEIYADDELIYKSGHFIF